MLLFWIGVVLVWAIVEHINLTGCLRSILKDIFKGK